MEGLSISLLNEESISEFEDMIFPEQTQSQSQPQSQTQKRGSETEEAQEVKESFD